MIEIRGPVGEAFVLKYRHRKIRDTCLVNCSHDRRITTHIRLQFKMTQQWELPLRIRNMAMRASCWVWNMAARATEGEEICSERQLANTGQQPEKMKERNTLYSKMRDVGPQQSFLYIRYHKSTVTKASGCIV